MCDFSLLHIDTKYFQHLLWKWLSISRFICLVPLSNINRQWMCFLFCRFICLFHVSARVFLLLHLCNMIYCQVVERPQLSCFCSTLLCIFRVFCDFIHILGFFLYKNDIKIFDKYALNCTEDHFVLKGHFIYINSMNTGWLSIICASFNFFHQCFTIHRSFASLFECILKYFGSYYKREHLCLC
jgi:hypothetical protein